MREIMAEITAWSWGYLTQQLLMLVLWVCLLRVMFKEVQALIMIIETPPTPPASQKEGLAALERFCRQSAGSRMRPSSFSISITQRTEFAQTEGHLSSCPPSLMNWSNSSGLPRS